MKKIVFTIVSLAILSCSDNSNQQKEQKEEILSVLKSKNYEAEKYFKTNLVIILSKELTNEATSISIQEYKSAAGDFIPAFTSMQAFKESTKGVDIGKQVMEVNGYFLLSLMDGTEIIKINPDLSDEKTFRASELLEQFKVKIADVKKKLNP